MKKQIVLVLAFPLIWIGLWTVAYYISCDVMKDDGTRAMITGGATGLATYIAYAIGLSS